MRNSSHNFREIHKSETLSKELIFYTHRSPRCTTPLWALTKCSI